MRRPLVNSLNNWDIVIVGILILAVLYAMAYLLLVCVLIAKRIKDRYDEEPK